MRGVHDRHDELLAREVTRLTRCWHIKRVDGVGGHDGQGNYFFTEHDRPFFFARSDGGDAGVYTPIGGSLGSNHRGEAGLKQADVETRGLVTDDGITEADLVGGRFRDATVRELLVDWMFPHHQQITTQRYRIGQVRWSNMMWVAELLGITKQLEQQRGRMMTRNCRHQVYEGICGLSVDKDNFRMPYMVGSSAPGPVITAVNTPTNITVQLPVWNIATHISQNGVNPHEIILTGSHLFKLGTGWPDTGLGWIAVRFSGTSTSTGPSINGVRYLAVANPGSTRFQIYTTARNHIPTAGHTYTGGVIRIDVLHPDVAGIFGVDELAAYWDRGEITWASGANQGQQNWIRSQAVPSYAGVPVTADLELEFEPTLPLVAGVQLDIVAGCDRLGNTCRKKFFAYEASYGGYEDIPGIDHIIKTPQAR